MTRGDGNRNIFKDEAAVRHLVGPLMALIIVNLVLAILGVNLEVLTAVGYIGTLAIFAWAAYWLFRINPRNKR